MRKAATLEAMDGTPAAQRENLGSARILLLARWQWAVLGLLLALLYLGVALKLVRDWWVLPDFSHGFVIPFFSAFLVWRRRAELRSAAVRPTWSGVPLVALAMFTLLAGTFGAELFLSRISFVMLAAGLVWTFAGAAMLRLLAFPILALLLAIPIPAVLFNQITFPLQLLASRLAGDTLSLLHIPVLREGNIIELPALKLEVAEACSGIRSLMSLLTLAIIYGALIENSTGRRIVLACAALPIAVAANALRIVGTGLCVQYWDPNRALGFFHEFSGWLMFVLSLFGIVLVQRLTHLGQLSRRTA